MTETIRLRVRLRAYVRRAGRQWVAVCPSVNVASQGPNREAAKKSLTEALELWFESCIERGTLDAALRDAGFTPKSWSSGTPPPDQHVQVITSAAEERVLGSETEVEIDIPAYQAAHFSSLASAAFA